MAARRNAALVAAGLVVGAVVGPPGLAAADKLAQGVFVTNTTDKPVPVAGAVTVSNLPATQQVAGSVEVSNPVTVTGAVDSAPRAPGDPFRAQVGLGFGDTGNTQALLEVPEGKTAVIETVSAFFQTPSRAVPVLQIGETVDRTFLPSTHYVAFTPQGTIPNSNPNFERSLFVATETVRLYAPPGSTVSANVHIPIWEGDPPFNFGFVRVTGYFTDGTT